jgi:PKD repeat protein
MKKIIYLLITLPLLLFSCEKSPESSFSVNTTEPEVGKPVLFTNTSHNGDSYEWDFGDGYMSYDSDPTHSYTTTGSYTVTLTTISKNRNSSTSSLTLNVLMPSLLVVEVREYYSNDLIPNASIILYSSLADWDAQKNKVIEGFTDKYGVAVFANLDPDIYYLDIWEATHDNYTLRNDDPGFIETPPVLDHKTTVFEAFVDVATHTNGVVRGSHGMVIKSLGRKAADKQKPQYSGTDNWQELYNRRVNK